MVRRIADRTRYWQRIADPVIKAATNAEEAGFELEVHVHWAKYTCVLISGFMEQQAIKEIFLEHICQFQSSHMQKCWGYMANFEKHEVRCNKGNFGPLRRHFDNGLQGMA